MRFAVHYLIAGIALGVIGVLIPMPFMAIVTGWGVIFIILSVFMVGVNSNK